MARVATDTRNINNTPDSGLSSFGVVFGGPGGAPKATEEGSDRAAYTPGGRDVSVSAQPAAAAGITHVAVEPITIKGGTSMSTMLNYLKTRLVGHARDQRGVVSVEWIILAIVVMVAIVAAFAPQFQSALKAGVSSVSSSLSAQASSAGSGS